MDYLTNYYKNLSEQLSAKVNYLQNLVEEITTQGTFSGGKNFGMMPAEIQTMQQTEKVPPPKQKQPPGGRGDGLAEGYEKPHKKGPTSEEWKKWVSQPGRWHVLNPHPYGSPEFYQWEWDYYQQPPGP